MTIRNLVCTILLITPAPSMASAAADAQMPDQLGPAVAVPGILNFGASLLLVIAAILAVGWFYARMQGMRSGTSNVIKLLASQPLGSKERVVLIEVGSKQLVIGITSASLQTLHVFDEPVVVAEASGHHSAFAERLFTTLQGGNK